MLDCIGGLIKFKASEPDGQFYTALFYMQWTDLTGLEAVMNEISRLAEDKIVPASSLYSSKDCGEHSAENTKCHYLLNTRSWARWLEDNRGDLLLSEIEDFFADEKNCERMNRETLNPYYRPG